MSGWVILLLFDDRSVICVFILIIFSRLIYIIFIAKLNLYNLHWMGEVRVRDGGERKEGRMSRECCWGVVSLQIGLNMYIYVYLRKDVGQKWFLVIAS